MSSSGLPGKARRSAKDAHAAGRRAGRQAAHSTWLRGLAGVGFAATGLLYLIIGYLALRIAFGDSGGQEASNSGALQLVAQNTGGMLLLWVAAAGLVGLTVWQAVYAAVGLEKATKRIASAARAVVYAVLASSIAGFLLGQGSPQSQDSQSEALTAQVMALPFGRFAVGAVGCGVIAVGLHQIWKAVTRRFTQELALGALTPRRRRAVVTVGVLGIGTQGLVLAAVGVFFLQAAIAFDKDQAVGLDGALRAFSQTPAGPWALVAVALGVAVYGAYCFCQARWQR
ncbi:DUF1206 domain-containing protein [Nocardiopsis deserti]|uniref:DUF1206 domain-containing protein n=1 Tax=Nocardiopsis deserti TaxID=2605988 RepID=UPI001CC24CF2|nr:DUF1206 domain-containing protein [Nocardiopsis deserti]